MPSNTWTARQRDAKKEWHLPKEERINRKLVLQVARNWRTEFIHRLGRGVRKGLQVNTLTADRMAPLGQTQRALALDRKEWATRGTDRVGEHTVNSGQSVSFR